MNLKYFLILCLTITAISLAGCNNDHTEPDDDDNDTIDVFTIPAYADDYSSIASWSDRNQWNLANVHDPSVAFYDGYYYMYGTDA